jgi:transposase
MGKKRKTHEWSEEKRGEVIGMWKVKTPVARIVELTKIPTRTVYDLIAKYKETKTTANKERSGRPRCTSETVDRRIKLIAVRESTNAKKIWQQLKQDNLFQKSTPHFRTIRNRLIDFGLDGRVMRKKPYLKVAQRMRRLQWCKEHRDWTVEQWSKVLFSDESPFTLFPDSGKQYTRRRRGEAYKMQHLRPTVKFGGGKIQVWGCFSIHGVGPLKRIFGKMNGPLYRLILKGTMAPYLRHLNDKDMIFQQDNDPKHTSKVAQNYLNNAKFKVLSWPSQSPDLNPIENLWNACKKAYFESPRRAKNLDEVFQIIEAEWNRIPQSTITKLIESMPRRINACIQNRGGHTKY